MSLLYKMPQNQNDKQAIKKKYNDTVLKNDTNNVLGNSKKNGFMCCFWVLYN